MGRFMQYGTGEKNSARVWCGIGASTEDVHPQHIPLTRSARKAGTIFLRKKGFLFGEY